MWRVEAHFGINVTCPDILIPLNTSRSNFSMMGLGMRKITLTWNIINILYQFEFYERCASATAKLFIMRLNV